MSSQTLRDKTDDLRRSHILEAAAGVFAEKGFHRATIKDVARAAGVSDGSIYNVFENKMALLLSLLAPLAAASESASSSPFEERDANAHLEGFIRQRWDAFSPATLQALRSVLAEALVNDELRQLFFDRVLAPALNGPGDVALAATGAPAEAATNVELRPLVGAMMGLILLRLLGDEPTEREWDSFPGRLARLFSPAPPSAG